MMRTPIVVPVARLKLKDIDAIADTFWGGLGPSVITAARLIAEIRKSWAERDAWKREAFAFALLYGTEHGRNERLRDEVALLRSEIKALTEEQEVAA